MSVMMLGSSIFIVAVISAVLFLGLTDFCNHRAFHRRKNDFRKRGEVFREGVCKVEIYCSDYEMKPLMKSFKVGLPGPNYCIDCNFLSTKDAWLLFLRKKALGGLYKRDIGHIELTVGSNSCGSVLISELDDNLLVSFKNPKSGVDKVLVYGYHSLMK